MRTSNTLFITGASGQLGRLVIDALLHKAPGSTIIAGVRDLASPAAVAFQSRGIEVRAADYDRAETLSTAFRGVDRLLLVSGSEIGRRKPQHRNVVAAARTADIALIAYTSILHADRSPLFLADEHRDTEIALAEAGVPYVLLRNGWYNEVYTWRLPLALQNQVLMGAASDGRISSAARADYAEAAATVLLSDDETTRTYELAGDGSFTLAELASIVAAASNGVMTYADMTPEAFDSALRAAGLPGPVARLMSDIDAGTAKGALFDDRRALARLIGRPTTTIDETIVGFVRNQQLGVRVDGHG